MKKTSVSVNRLAWKLLDELLENTDRYGVKVTKTTSGTTVVDAGIKATGGFEAGRIITEICMGGCGKAQIVFERFGDIDLPSVQICSDNPVIATLGSQYAGWQINEDDYFAIGSGPARALAQKPKDIYAEIGYIDHSDKGIAILETDKTPPEKLIQRLAKDCHLPPEDLAIVLTPTTSMAGTTQISGRIVETGIHKLRRIGLNPNEIIYASGYAPISPIHPKFTKAMARTNDSILYGGVTYYVVEHGTDENLQELVKKAPSVSSEVYGKPFIDIFKEAKNDFYKIDPNLFAPAVVTIVNSSTGSVFISGTVNAKALKESYDLNRDYAVL